MSLPYALGAHPSPPDARDYAVSDFLPATLPTLPPELDLRPCLQAVRNQLDFGACVAFALGSGVMGELEQTEGHPAYQRVLSPLDLYVNTRATMVPAPPGEGLYPRSALQIALTVGVALEADRPYHPHADPGPGPDAATHRAQNRIGSYAAVGALVPEIKAAMFQHGPILIALTVTDGFCYPDAHHMLTYSGKEHGGHGVCLVGWDDSKQAWLMRNSWGPEWADGGYAWLPWSYPIGERWAVTPALVDGKPPTPHQDDWMTRMLAWLGGVFHAK